jgi:ureidoacrylate peracid hydrolase
MHDVEIGPEIIERVLARRGRVHIFDHFEPRRTALVVIDMQPTFVAENSPAEVPAARSIVDNINKLARALRARGVLICWVCHANARIGEGSDWAGFFDCFVSEDVRLRTIESLAQGSPDTAVWSDLEVKQGDLQLYKNRYSALIAGASGLERALRSRGVENILIAGTKTNVCCEATGRDAMMLDFNTVMVSDCLAALSDEEHKAALETFIQQFGDVMTAGEAVELVSRQPNTAK